MFHPGGARPRAAGPKGAAGYGAHDAGRAGQNNGGHLQRRRSRDAGRLAGLAVEETGFGLKADKEIKNRFAAVTLYDAIKDEKTHGILAQDREKRTIDIGVPVGVVAGLVPSTNPTSTVIYKSMICMKAGNPIIFPHPSAVKCILETVEVVRRAAEAAGGSRQGPSPASPPPRWRPPTP